MGKGKKETKRYSEMKIIYTHGKKRNDKENVFIQEGNGTIIVNIILIQKFWTKKIKSKNIWIYFNINIWSI